MAEANREKDWDSRFFRLFHLFAVRANGSNASLRSIPRGEILRPETPKAASGLPRAAFAAR
jgi:hypothetical protein